MSTRQEIIGSVCALSFLVSSGFADEKIDWDTDSTVPKIIFAGQLLQDNWNAERQYSPRNWELLDKFLKDMNKCVDEVEFMIGYANPKYGGPSTGLNPFTAYSDFHENPEAAGKIIKRIQDAIDIIHKNGIKVVFYFRPEGNGLWTESVGDFGVPGAQADDFVKHPEYQAETLNPKTGEFIVLKNFLDWGNEEAVNYCLKYFGNTLKMIKDIDYYQIHEETLGWYRGMARTSWDKGLDHPKLGKWYKVPLFSKAALESYRKYLKDPAALFPSPTGTAKTDRTFITDKEEDWNKWKQWLEDVYTDFTRRRVETIVKANKGNPRFKGVVYFYLGWMASQYSGVNPDRMAEIKDMVILNDEWMSGGEGLRKKEIYDRLVKIKSACENNNKIFGAWWYWGSSYDCITVNRDPEVKRIRQYYTVNLFKKFVEFGARRLNGWHIAEFCPLAIKESNGRIDANRELTNGEMFDPDIAEMMAILKKKYGDRKELNKEEKNILKLAGSLPKFSERKRVINVKKKKEEIKIDGVLDEWDKSRPIIIDWKNMIKGNGALGNYDNYSSYSGRHYDARLYFSYDEENIYYGGEIKDANPHPAYIGSGEGMDGMRVRINLENPDNKSAGWLSHCKEIGVNFGTKVIKPTATIGTVNIKVLNEKEEWVDADGGVKLKENKPGEEYYRYNIEGKIPIKAIDSGMDFKPEKGKVISLGLSMLQGRYLGSWQGIDGYISEGSISVMGGGDVGREELWGYGLFE